MDWIEYWDQDSFWAHSKLWKVNARLFLRRATPILKFKRADSVLNVGCGAGYLEELLAPMVESITSVDTSEQFVELCQRNCRGLKNVAVLPLRNDYTDLSQLRRRFSLFLCVSTTQYYRHKSDMEALIRSAQEVALPGARMLIADLPQLKGPLGLTWDAWCSLLLSIKEGYVPVLFHTAWVLALGKSGAPHRSFSRKAKILYFSDRELQDLIHRLGLKATVIRTDLSAYANRPSLLIRF